MIPIKIPTNARTVQIVTMMYNRRNSKKKFENFQDLNILKNGVSFRSLRSIIISLSPDAN